MYGVISFAVLVAACLVQSSRAEVLNNGDVFQVYPALEDAPEGTTPLYFALMQSFSGGYVSAGGIPGLMVALDEINNNSDILPGYSLHYTLSDNGVCRLVCHKTVHQKRLFLIWVVSRSQTLAGSGYARLNSGRLEPVGQDARLTSRPSVQNEALGTEDCLCD